MSSSKPNAEELLAAQIARNNRQAEFFEARAQQIANAATQTPQRPRWTFAQRMAGIAQVVAFLTLMATLITSCRNLAEMRRGREDTAFYEALRRMGDKDSPLVRASAAELLASKAADPDYLPAAQSQLLHALLLEDNPVVLGAIQDACGSLSKQNSQGMRDALKIVFAKLEVQVLETLAPLTLDKHGKAPAATTDISESQWIQIEALIPQTDLKRADFEALITQREETFGSYQDAAEVAWENTPEDERAELEAAWKRAFQAAALRLRLTRRLLESDGQKDSNGQKEN